MPKTRKLRGGKPTGNVHSRANRDRGRGQSSAPLSRPNRGRGKTSSDSRVAAGRLEKSTSKNDRAIDVAIRSRHLEAAFIALSNTNPVFLGPYSSRQRILLLGEADLSFTAALLAGLGVSSNIVATCFESEATLNEKYSAFAARRDALLSAGVEIKYEVDATCLHEPQGGIGPDRETSRFDVCVFNFPHVGGGSLKEDRVANIQMLSGFFASSRQTACLAKPRARVHVVLRSTAFYDSWDVCSIAKQAGLRFLNKEPFEVDAFEQLGYCAVRTSGDGTQMRQAPSTEKAFRYVFQIEPA
ncbi:25S rRNA (uridine-N(3))-methyltransferase [Porphyridium purpureum]|uniref:25S rRNA (Uridine-N(3))-methyltransferase n=1 Tax=Porphyridium purpureum TaxID=35688 RepID=A0A5J4Z2P2_PORPP|nr:25S rRNA (uridine-N(3))-methyltransferase [Porphyridium purpureum]|eukprot:POR7042..scf208_2